MTEQEFANAAEAFAEKIINAAPSVLPVAAAGCLGAAAALGIAGEMAPSVLVNILTSAIDDVTGTPSPWPTVAELERLTAERDQLAARVAELEKQAGPEGDKP